MKEPSAGEREGTPLAGKEPSAGEREGTPLADKKLRLPTGIQTFREVREEDCYYVDKTPYIQRLVEGGKHYFLSRPRRFGKSLLLDTIKELFEGNEPLFRGLCIHPHWDWAVRHPVLRLDFSGNFGGLEALRTNLMQQLDEVEADAGLSLMHRYDDASARCRQLLRALHRETGRRAVVLVDEYDKPILDVLDAPDAARANRDYLHGLYSAIKSCDADVRFTLVTGVTRFSKVSLFSGLNHLTDITLEPAHSAICGYTDEDLDRLFAPELPGLRRQAIRDWYNGYCWLGKEKVYNPYDILQLFGKRRFDAYWFETGTPSFLVRTLLENRVLPPSLDGLLASGDLLGAFDVGDIATEALLFQTGYLTVLDMLNVDGEPHYRLGYPNREVRQSLNRRLLRAMLPDAAGQVTERLRLRELLAANDLSGIEEFFRAFFASIPYNWHVNNPIANYEGYYASLFYAHFAAAGLDVTTEDASSQGRLDMAVYTDDNVYLFDFKVAQQAPQGEALAQLKERRYADKYRDLGKTIHLVGVEFSKETRNIAAFASELG